MRPIPDPRELRPGERLVGLPASSVNAGIEAYRELRRQPWARKGRPSSGGGSGGGSDSTFRRVRVYDDLLGGDPTATGKVTVATVRCLYETRDGDGWLPDLTGDFIHAEPTSHVARSLADGGCCDGTAAPTGLVIDQPLMAGTNRVTDATDEAVVVSGSGADPFGTVTVTISGSGSDVVQSAIDVAADGTWSSGSLNVTGHAKGVLGVKAQAFDASNDPYPPRYVALTYAKGDGTVDLARFSGLPPTPIVLDAIQVGTDRFATDDLTPTVQVRHGSTTVVDTTGPTPLIRKNASVWLSGDVNTFDNLPGGDVADFTPASNEAEGVYAIQLVLRIEEAGPTFYYGPASLPVYLTISADALEAAPSSQVSVRGLVATIDGVLTLVSIEDCPIPLVQAEVDKLNA